MLNRSRVVWCVIVLSTCCASVTAEDAARVATNWPQWRGPNRDDVASDKGLLQSWPESGPPLVWTAPGLGDGYSSVVIDKGRIYTTGERKDGVFLICLNDANGRELWSKRIGAAWHDGGARSTPATDGELVYALTPDGDLVCASTADGAIVWQKNLKKDFGGRMMSGWGYSESPLIDGQLIVCTPGADQAALVALDRKNGQSIWSAKIENCGGAGYSSIVKSSAAGVEQFITVLGKTGGLVGVRASDGKLLWQHAEVAGGTANIPTPIVHGDFVFYTTGYEDGGSALLKIVRHGSEFAIEEIWQKKANELRNHHGGVVLVGDYLYGGHGQNQGFPFCVRFETGESLWPIKRGPGTGSAAVTYADRRLYFRYQDGTMALIDADPKECKVVSTFKIPEGKQPSWSHPVVAGGRLYLRDKDRLLCFNIRSTSESASAKHAIDASHNNKHDVVRLSPAAIAKVREFQKQTGKPFLRVSVKGGGISGYSYDMGMTNDRSENDFVGDAGGIQILVDHKSSIFLDGATIDWQTTTDGRTGFHFDNPNALKK
jgi:outer membrane protein assembly factor BamB